MGYGHVSPALWLEPDPGLQRRLAEHVISWDADARPRRRWMGCRVLRGSTGPAALGNTLAAQSFAAAAAAAAAAAFRVGHPAGARGERFPSKERAPAGDPLRRDPARPCAACGGR